MARSAGGDRPPARSGPPAPRRRRERRPEPPRNLPVEAGRGRRRRRRSGLAEPGRTGPRPPDAPRHVHAVPTSDELKCQRALELFNVSEHPRVVAGVARSLGAPGVAVRALVDPSSRVASIVVSWELCWYRYEVDLADEGDRVVRKTGQGYELGELSDEDLNAIAVADEHGALALAA